MTRLQVYQDPSLAGGRGAVPDSNTTPRKGVSFSANTKTPRESGAAYRTPFRSHDHQSHGVTPKSGKSPKMMVGSFRQSLKTPTPSRGQRPVFGEKDAKENTQNRQTPENKKFYKSNLKTPPPVMASNARINEREAHSATTTPTSAGVIRRTLRATVVPGERPRTQLETRQTGTTSASIFPVVTTRNDSSGAAIARSGSNQTGKSRILSKTGLSSTTGTFKSLGPPQRVVPKTPNSLLRQEMEVMNSSSSFSSPGDESLLLSPPPGAVWNALNVSESRSVAATTGLVILSPQAAEQVHAWSSVKKDCSMGEMLETRTEELDTDDHPSPALPRMLSLRTPQVDKVSLTSTDEDAFQNEESNEAIEVLPVESVISVEKHDTNVIQKASNGGVAMELTGMFSATSCQPAAKETPIDELAPKLTPLSASVPAALLSRLDAKRRTAPKPPKTEQTHVLQKFRQLKKLDQRRKNIGLGPKSIKTPLTLSSQKSVAGSLEDSAKIPVCTTVPKTKVQVSSTVVTSERSKRKKIPPFSITKSESIESSHRGGMAFDISFGNEKKDSSSSNRFEPTRKDLEDKSDAAALPLSWADKQSESFVGWLNYTFNPDEEERQGGSTVASGLRGLLIHRRLAQVRTKASELFHSDVMRHTRLTLVKEISRGRLSIREDRDVTADIQLRRQLVSLLLSYTTPWLRMGLEVMFDECIEPIPMTTDGPKTFVGCMRVALESFIKKRFLSDAETLTKYTKGRCTVPSGAFETRYKAQMRTLVLSRLMTLVFFLDLAKMENVIDKVPRLFGVSSEVKSSRDVLAMICRDCLSAEGDIVKHFSRIGLSVRYHQDPVDEVNLKVVNLATDLRDGVLLTRLSEIIMGVSFKSFMKTLRLPAVSRLQKKFNVNLALEKLRSFGVVIGSEINAHHIMDGHREMVLTLMWCIIAHCCLSKLLQEGHIEQEIKDVIRSSRERSKFQLGVLKGSHGDAGTSTKAIQKTESSSTERALKSLLKQWSQAVCSSFDLHVENFTDSFADGKVICALIHYYHPSLISLEHVVSFGEDDCVSQDARLEQERKNWKMALHSIRELGGVPAVFPICDSMSPPDEQSVLLCLSYLCSRLMESSKEIFATILIQACYRKYQRKLLLERKMKAAKVILQSWRENRGNYFRAQRQQYTLAVRVLEGFFLDHRYALLMLREARLERERRHQAAVTVQKVFRGLLGREILQQKLIQHRAAICVQSFWRGILAVWKLQDLFRRNEGAIVLQSCFRRIKAQGRRQHLERQIRILQQFARRFVAKKVATKKHSAVLTIQNVWWSYVARQNMQFATVLLQTSWRRYVARKEYSRLIQERTAACLIQKSWRGFSQYLQYWIVVESTILVQRMIRGFLSRKNCSLLRCQLAATQIQKVWKGFSQQVQFQIDLLDVISVQSVARRFLARKQKHKILGGILTIQCAIRSALARQQSKILAHEKGAAIALQTFGRRLIAQTRFIEFRNAAIMIQREWRVFNVKRVMKYCATKIQALYRSHVKKLRFLTYKEAAKSIQKYWRGHELRENITKLSFAATLIQCHWRRFWIQTDYELFLAEVKATILIQSYARRHLVRKNFLLVRSSAALIQTRWRKHHLLVQSNNAATLIQTVWRTYSLKQCFTRSVRKLVLIQSVIRSSLAKNKTESRRRENAALTLQRTWRGFSQQVKFQLDIMDIVCVQSLVRRNLCQNAYRSMICGAMTLQRAVRCALARKELSLRILGRREIVLSSVIKIQTLARLQSARLRYMSQRCAAFEIQRVWRGSVTRSIHAGLSQAACLIQCNWRRYFVRCRYLLHLLEVKSAVMIQSVVRMYQNLVTMERNHKAATALQCLARASKSKNRLALLVEQKKDYMLRSCSAVHLQRIFRGKQERKLLCGKHTAATCIQSHWRCYVAQNGFLLSLLEDRSATVVQATFRMYMQRLDYMVIKFATLAIQRCTRGWLVREDIALRNFAASDIQRIWRGHRTYSIESIIFFIVRIQSLFRRAIARHRFEELRILYWADICFRQRKASLIQQEYRKHVMRKRMNEASTVIQRAFRFYSQLKRIQLVSRGMIQMQSVYRGWHERRHRNKKVARAAQRIQHETKRALSHPEMRLGNRTNRALDILQHSQSLTRIMEAVKELEASTRLSVVCCQLFTKVNAANILLHLIQSCNRSVPHMELKEHILLTLENVSRYPTLVQSFAHYKYAEVFLDNVQVFRDKDGIFCLAVSLLDRISKANPSVAEFCSSHEHLKRLKEVFRVVNRLNKVRNPKKAVMHDTLKKRVYFDRNGSVHLLEHMIETFSILAMSLNHNQAFTFES